MSNIDWDSIGVSVGAGLATGFGVLGAVNIIGLPVSYMANRYIYHNKGMRFLLCIVAAILSIPLFIGMSLYQLMTGGGISKVHYFGYFPFLVKREDKIIESKEMGWIEPLVIPVWNWIRDVVFGGFIDNRDLPADQAAYEHAADSILLPLELKGSDQAISEAAVGLALEAAEAPNQNLAEMLEKQQMAA
jgi:hypothetical protein